MSNARPPVQDKNAYEPIVFLSSFILVQAGALLTAVQAAGIKDPAMPIIVNVLFTVVVCASIAVLSHLREEAATGYYFDRATVVFGRVGFLLSLMQCIAVVYLLASGALPLEARKPMRDTLLSMTPYQDISLWRENSQNVTGKPATAQMNKAFKAFAAILKGWLLCQDNSRTVLVSLSAEPFAADFTTAAAICEHDPQMELHQVYLFADHRESSSTFEPAFRLMPQAIDPANDYPTNRMTLLAPNKGEYVLAVFRGPPSKPRTASPQVVIVKE